VTASETLSALLALGHVVKVDARRLPIEVTVYRGDRPGQPSYFHGGTLEQALSLALSGTAPRRPPPVADLP
jgi:hypothetical protein